MVTPDSRADEQIYAPGFVHGLFEGMAATYGVVNLISSFGFCWRWRRQCVGHAELRRGMTVYDLMSGMGECSPEIGRRVGPGRLISVDFSGAMCERARQTVRRIPQTEASVLQEDVLTNSIPDASADAIISAFGLKTFSAEQRVTLAEQVARILKPGGTFSFLEISVSSNWLLRWFFMFYLERCVPVIGAIFLGDPANYRMLGIYTRAFGDCADTASALRGSGLEVEAVRLFFGCATLVRGYRPEAPT